MFSEKIGSENLYFYRYLPDKHHLCTGSQSNECSRQKPCREAGVLCWLLALIYNPEYTDTPTITVLPC